MNKYIIVSIFAAIIALSAGCSSTVSDGMNLYDQNLTASTGKTVCHVNTEISGTYILGFIPIAAGDPENPGKMVWFQNTVTIENALDMLTKNAGLFGVTRTYDIQTNSYASVYEYSFFLLWVKRAQASGNLVR